MLATKNILLTFLLFFTLTSGFGQIITSKKEAVKKGVYTSPEANSKKNKSQGTDSASSSDAKIAKNNKSSNPNLKNIIAEENDDDIVISEPENYVAIQMINNAMQFLGVRYRGGGTSTDGMDCSGMVTAVYNLFGIPIPRSSREMATIGEKIDSAQVKKGDLIFFKTNGRRAINHVGMVIDIVGDEIKFIHSSTSKGVIISSTKEHYYQKTFAQINRILSNL